MFEFEVALDKYLTTTTLHLTMSMFWKREGDRFSLDFGGFFDGKSASRSRLIVNLVVPHNKFTNNADEACQASGDYWEEPGQHWTLLTRVYASSNSSDSTGMRSLGLRKSDMIVRKG